MVVSRRNRDRVAHARGHRHLAVEVISPGGDGSVCSKHQAMVSPRVDGDHIGQPWWRADLAIVIVPPTGNRAVIAERKTEIFTTGDGADFTAQSSRNGCFSEIIESPGQDSAITGQGQTVITSGGDGGHVGEV